MLLNWLDFSLGAMRFFVIGLPCWVSWIDAGAAALMIGGLRLAGLGTRSRPGAQGLGERLG